MAERKGIRTTAGFENKQFNSFPLSHNSPDPRETRVKTGINHAGRAGSTSSPEVAAWSTTTLSLSPETLAILGQTCGLDGCRVGDQRALCPGFVRRIADAYLRRSM
jgi:hypothetical protein